MTSSSMSYGGAKHQHGQKRKDMKTDSNDSDRVYANVRPGNNSVFGKGGEGDGKAGIEDIKQGDVDDDVNIKRSIEMKNGIALRSMNNFHKGTNAINLHNYKVSPKSI